MSRTIDRFALRLMLIGWAAIVPALAQNVSQSYYEITNLGVLPGQTYSMALAINDRGVIVGRSGTYNSDNAEQPLAFVYQNCQMTNIGPADSGQSAAQAISPEGTAVGWYLRSDGTMRAFSYFGGMSSDLGGDPKFLTSAWAISSWQLPVGIQSVTPTLGVEGVWFFAGKTIALPTYLAELPDGYTSVQSVTGVNDLLQVTGYFTDGEGNMDGLVSGVGFGQWTKIQGIADLTPSLVPSAINFSGHVVGGSGWPSPHAFLSTDPNSPALDLGTIGGQGSISSADAINNRDWVVGYSGYQSDQSGFPHAFLYNGNAMTDLNTRVTNGAGWELVEATGINDGGQIVGWGFYNEQRRAFLLTPTSRFPLPPAACLPGTFFP